MFNSRWNDRGRIQLTERAFDEQQVTEEPHESDKHQKTNPGMGERPGIIRLRRPKCDLQRPPTLISVKNRDLDVIDRGVIAIGLFPMSLVIACLGECPTGGEYDGN